MSPVASSRVHVGAIIQAVSQLLHVAPEHIYGNSKRRDHVNARRVAMYIARFDLQLSYPEMGRAFRRDHTSCMDAVRYVNRASSRGDLWRNIESVREMLRTAPRMQPCAVCQEMRIALEIATKALTDAQRVLLGAA